jgi:hypothetical protein
VTELLPGPAATALLQAMLLDGDAARAAWARCTLPVEPALRPLLPLLYDSVRRNALPLDAENATVLRSAYLTESLRSRTFRGIVDDLVARLHGIRFLLVKGAAVGELYYADPALRHAHDVEIVAPRFEPVRRALEGSSFRRGWRHRRRFVHDSGLPLRVHARIPVAPVPALTLANGAQTLDAAAALALALVQSPRWVADAFFIARSGTVDWNRFARALPNRRAARMAAIRLAWLAETMGVLKG